MTGVQGIQQVMDALASMGLSDKVTFATWNVFGRNLNGISKVEQRQGRDHYPNHCASVLIGKNIAPGVIGGIPPVSDRASNGALGAADIDSATGAGVAGGDIPRTETHVALARTLGAALGKLIGAGCRSRAVRQSSRRTLRLRTSSSAGATCPRTEERSRVAIALWCRS